MKIKRLFSSCILSLILLNFNLCYAESIPTRPKALYITPQQAKQWVTEGKGITFVDVRQPKEYKAGHIQGAISVPYDKIARYIKKFNKNYPCIIYCTFSAWRAPYAANTLADMGYQNVYVLEGGITAWYSGGQIIYANSTDTAKIIPYEGLAPNLAHPKDKEYKTKIDLTLAELAQYDGKDGHLAYVAVNGIIYDLTESRLWRGGIHDPSHGMATAGKNLTEVIKQSPHGVKELKKFPIVGRLLSEDRGSEKRIEIEDEK